MSAPTSQPVPSPPSKQMLAMLNGVYVAGAIACLAELGIPDLVASGPRSADDLAQEIEVLPHTLYRLMRATASVGVLEELADRRFAETPLSAVLRSDASPSLRGLAIMTGREWHGRGWAHLADCIRTGRQATELLEGKAFFDYIAQHPKEAAIFDGAMTAISSVHAPAIVASYPFAEIRSVVDIAGGAGLLLATILKANPHVQGTLYDLPNVIARAKSGPLRNLLDRCSFASGDMFTSVPPGADACLMKHIIHDWSDEDCVRLLKVCREAATPASRLLVIESVIEPGNAFSPGKFLDLQMLIFPGGRERTADEFRQLFEAGGWKLNRIVPMPIPESILEAVPA